MKLEAASRIMNSSNGEFKKLSTMQEFERLRNLVFNYQTVKLKGHWITILSDSRRNVVGAWYEKAEVGSSNLKFKGAAARYVREDPYSPLK